MKAAPSARTSNAPVIAASRAFDTNNPRPAINTPIAAHRGKGLVDGVFASRIGDQDHWHRFARAARLRGAARSGVVALHDRFQRNLLLRETARDSGRGAWPVAR